MIVPFILAASLLAQSPADAIADQALAAAQQGDSAAASRLWEQAIQRDPKHYPALFNYGVFLHRNHKPGEAAPLLDRAAKLQSNYQVQLIRGMNFQQLDRRDDAIRAWRAALAFQPKNVKLMQVLGVEYTKGRYFQEAAAITQQALQVDPADSNLYFLAIKACQDAGDVETGSRLAAEAVRRFPDLARANFEHAFYLQKRGEIEPAVAHLRKAIEQDPAYEEPPFFLGDLLVKQARYEEAIPFLQAAIDRRKDYVPARVLLGRALMNLERWDEAIRELKATVELAPSHPQPHLLLSQVYFRQGKEAEAKVERDLSLKLRRENPALLEAVQGRPFGQ